jgi:hypothetical protein
MPKGLGWFVIVSMTLLLGTLMVVDSQSESYEVSPVFIGGYFTMLGIVWGATKGGFAELLGFHIERNQKEDSDPSDRNPPGGGTP